MKAVGLLECLKVVGMRQVLALASCLILISIPMLIGIASAGACEGGGEEVGGLLAFETALFIEEGKTATFNVKYTGFGESSTLSSKIEKGPFSIPGGTCNGNSIKNGEKCTVQITCKGKAGETGRVRVHAESIFVGDAVAEPGCI
jgi:hypothetical protein